MFLRIFESRRSLHFLLPYAGGAGPAQLAGRGGFETPTRSSSAVENRLSRFDALNSSPHNPLFRRAYLIPSRRMLGNHHFNVRIVKPVVLNFIFRCGSREMIARERLRATRKKRGGMR
jgi:hypothetical protein